jgi:hypothetical protein
VKPAEIITKASEAGCELSASKQGQLRVGQSKRLPPEVRAALAVPGTGGKVVALLRGSKPASADAAPFALKGSVVTFTDSAIGDYHLVADEADRQRLQSRPDYDGRAVLTPEEIDEHDPAAAAVLRAFPGARVVSKEEHRTAVEGLRAVNMTPHVTLYGKR